MSLHAATNLSTAKRRDRDFYVTPNIVTAGLICAEGDQMPGEIWEPACGLGQMAELIAETGRSVFASDIKPLCRAGEQRSFYDFNAHDVPCRAVVTNPPFKDANAKNRNIWQEQGYRLGLEYMALLLPSNWPYASGCREFLSRWPLSREWKIAWRIDWGRGGSSPANHSWFVWDARTKGRSREMWKTGVIYREIGNQQISMWSGSVNPAPASDAQDIRAKSLFQ